MLSNRHAALVSTALLLLAGVKAESLWAAQPLDPATLLAEIRAVGAYKVAQDLSANTRQWNEAMKKISGGSRDWLEVAAQLKAGTDAGDSETLTESVFLALKPAPRTVLRMLKKGQFELQEVCSSVIGNDYQPPESLRIIDERLAALQRVREPDLADTKARCEQGLREALKDLAGTG